MDDVPTNIWRLFAERSLLDSTMIPFEREMDGLVENLLIVCPAVSVHPIFFNRLKCNKESCINCVNWSFILLWESTLCSPMEDASSSVPEDGLWVSSLTSGA